MILNEVERVLTDIEELEELFKNSKDYSVIMFADLTNSTLYKEKRGFLSGLRKTKKHNDTITKIINDYGGCVIKYIGDAVMGEFKLKNEHHLSYIPINAAIRIIESFEEYNQGVLDDFERIETKIGLAVGKVVYFYNSDPQGSIVDLASRIEATAKPNQILVQKEVLDLCDKSLISSMVGRGLQFSSNDYISAPVKLKLKGVESPQDIVEVRAGSLFKGIKRENEYPEYWENYRFEAYLYNLENNYTNSDFIQNNYFKIIYDLRYETVLKKNILKFVCVRDIEEMNMAMHDTNLFSRYMLPIRKDIVDNISQIYKTNFVEINGHRLKEINDIQLKQSEYYYSQSFDCSELSCLIGKKVSIRYRITTVINKFGHFYTMVTEYPIKNLSMVFDIGDTNISQVCPIDCFSSGNVPKYTYTPAKDNIKKIEVTVGKDEWVYPRSGVTFVWRLANEISDNAL